MNTDEDVIETICDECSVIIPDPRDAITGLDGETLCERCATEKGV